MNKQELTNHAGELYYRRGCGYFELEQYEQAVEDWICAYELGYCQEKILEDLYQCFILPNDAEFRGNYESNNKDFTDLAYEACTLDFIPVSDEKFYIYDRKECKFLGAFTFQQFDVQEKADLSNGVLYTDIWDIREVIADMTENNYGAAYLLLGELEEKFVSFFKLPEFRQLCMEKVLLFHDADEMKQFFLRQADDAMPKQLMTLDSEKYLCLLNEVQVEKQKLRNHNLLFLIGQSQYGALRRTTTNLMQAFQQIGYNVLLIDLLAQDSERQILMAEASYKFDVIITCNMMGCDADFVLHGGKKYCSMIGDHPIWHKDRLLFADKDTIVGYADQYNLNYAKTYHPNIGRAIYSMGGSNPLNETVAYTARSFEVVFIGGYDDPQKWYDKICNDYSGDIKELVFAFTNRLVQCPSLTYEEGLRKTLGDFGLVDFTNEQFSDIAYEFRFVDKYIRAYYRDRVIRAVIESGITIHVSGNGWEHFESEYSDRIIIENNDWYTARKMLVNAKISLNVMPWFKEGFHDRIELSMLSGSVLVTDTSERIEATFRDMEHAVLYHLETIEEIPGKIKYLLAHPEEAEQIAANGKKIAQKIFSIEDRVKHLAAVFQEEIGEPVEFLEKGRELELAEAGAKRRSVAQDVLESLKNLDQLLKFFKTGSTSVLMNANDYAYIVEELEKAAKKLQKDFPDITMGSYVWERLTDLQDPVSEEIHELLQMQIGYLTKTILWDCLPESQDF